MKVGLDKIFKAYLLNISVKGPGLLFTIYNNCRKHFQIWAIWRFLRLKTLIQLIYDEFYMKNISLWFGNMAENHLKILF